MKKSASLWFFLLATALLAVQPVEAVEEMGGYVVNGGGGGFDDGGSDAFVDSGGRFHDGGFDHGGRSIETDYNTRRLVPPEPRPEPESTLLSTFLSFSLFGAVISYVAFSWYTHKKTTLMMVQVAIKNSTPEVQRHLSQTAKKWTMQDGKGSSSKGARGILSDTISHILLHSDHCFSAASFVTVLVAAFGAYKLPAIYCLADLKKAFSCLQSAHDYTAAVKVFWTPPDGSSKILEEELVEEFPQLKPLESQRSHYKAPTINFRPPASVPVS